jgi:hypothetical protein
MQMAPLPTSARQVRTASSPCMAPIVTYCAHMSDADDPLERLSSEELHDLAVRHARRHLNVRFFWRLIEVLPAAEAAAGERDEAAADVNTLSAHLDDITNSGRGEVAELLRPFYLDYLRDHGVEPRA